MRKIAVITTVHSRYDIRIFLKECRSLASHGHDVTLVVQDGRGHEKREGVKIHDLGAPPTGRIRRIILSPWKAYRFVRSVPADIIHFHDPELLPLGLFLKFGKSNVVYDSHEDVPRQILTKHWINPLLRKIISSLFEIFENFITKRLDAVVCATPYIAKRFQRINPNSINVSNFPILDEFEISGNVTATPFSRTICYIGAITRERGISELLTSLEILQDVKLILCGPFESKAYELELIASPGWKFVDYRGVVGRDEVGQVLSSSAVGIVTLLPSPNQIDALPIKMFEYMSAGISFVASDFPLWREIVEGNQCGLCVDPSSPKEIAQAIEKFLSDETLCREMGCAGQKAIAGKYNWQKEAEKLFDLYETL